MKEIKIDENRVDCCLDKCCFGGKVKFFEEDGIIVATDGVWKKYLKKGGIIYYLHRENGSYYVKGKTNFGFKLNGWGVSNNKFAIKTDHLICKNCGDFCKQECFF